MPSRGETTAAQSIAFRVPSFSTAFTVAFTATAGDKSYKGKLKLPNVSEDHEGSFEMSLKWEGKKPASSSVAETTLLGPPTPNPKPHT